MLSTKVQEVSEKQGNSTRVYGKREASHATTSMGARRKTVH